MLNAAIVGGSGYTGAELLRILTRHPDFTVTSISSRQYKGKKVAEVFPSLLGLVDLRFTEPNPDVIVESSDAIFTALPHQTAMEIIPRLLVGDKKLVDLSADFRFRDARVYEEWYQPHTAPDLLKKAVYGLPELYFDEIAKTRLVGNPGCYPTSVILGLAPVLTEKLVEPDSIIADSKSGVSGAGRGLSLSSLYCEANDSIKAYKVGQHRHTPEIEQELSALAGERVVITFTPHLTPMTRGIFSAVYARLTKPVKTAEVLELYTRFYQGKPFVRVHPEGSLPSTAFVSGTNYADLGVKVDERTGRLIVMAAIDNLVKGASGQAVQNMNIMCGLDQTAGLDHAPLYP